jgi:hypothetical protein
MVYCPEEKKFIRVDFSSPKKKEPVNRIKNWKVVPVHVER